MTITLDLTPAQEARLRERAAIEGKEPAVVLAELLDNLPEAPSVPATVQTWGQHIIVQLEADGVIGLFADRSEDSPELARKFQERAETRGPLPCD